MLRWLVEEVRSVVSVTLYFAACFAVIILLEQMWLAEYGIKFRGIATALLAALVTAKVVIILDHTPLTRWLQGAPGGIEVISLSLIYTFAVLVVMLVEKAFESRIEHGGLMAALASVFEHPDMHKVWAYTICVGVSFLAYTAFGVVQRALGARRMIELFLSSKTRQPRRS
jgi:hypothetical protein